MKGLKLLGISGYINLIISQIPAFRNPDEKDLWMSVVVVLISIFLIIRIKNYKENENE